MEQIKLSEELVQAAKEVAEIDGCTLSEQIEHWARVGRLMEENPEIPYEVMLGLMLEQSEAEEEV